MSKATLIRDALFEVRDTAHRNVRSQFEVRVDEDEHFGTLGILKHIGPGEPEFVLSPHDAEFDPADFCWGPADQNWEDAPRGDLLSGQDAVRAWMLDTWIDNV